MPASSRIFIGAYDFDLAIPGKNAPIRGRRRFPHIISEPALGPGGPIQFTMQDWSQGQQTVEEGIEFHQKPKYISSKGAECGLSGPGDLPAPGHPLSRLGLVRRSVQF